MKKGLIAVFIALSLLAVTVGIAGAITNGEPDAGRHPYVGLLNFDDEDGPAWRCSGSLIAPDVVLTAGHCTAGAVAARVWFDEIVEGNPDFPLGGLSAVEGKPFTNPDFCIGCGNGLPGFAIRDVGIVVLDEPVDVGGLAELPDEGFVDTLKNKT